MPMKVMRNKEFRASGIHSFNSPLPLAQNKKIQSNSLLKRKYSVLEYAHISRIRKKLEPEPLAKV